MRTIACACHTFVIHSHIVFHIEFYCFYSHVRSWNAGSSLKLVQPHLTGGQENFSVGDQSQAVCSHTLLENQSSVKKPKPQIPSNSSKPTSVVRKVSVGELRNVKDIASECPNTNALLKGKAVQEECNVSNDNPEQRIPMTNLKSHTAENPVSEGNTPLTSIFWTFSVMLFEYRLCSIWFGRVHCH